MDGKISDKTEWQVFDLKLTFTSGFSLRYILFEMLFIVAIHWNEKNKTKQKNISVAMDPAHIKKTKELDIFSICYLFTVLSAVCL